MGRLKQMEPNQTPNSPFGPQNVTGLDGTLFGANLNYCTAHAGWDVSGHSNPFRPLKLPICDRLLKGVHKKKAVPGGVP